MNLLRWLLAIAFILFFLGCLTVKNGLTPQEEDWLKARKSLRSFALHYVKCKLRQKFKQGLYAQRLKFRNGTSVMLVVKNCEVFNVPRMSGLRISVWNGFIDYFYALYEEKIRQEVLRRQKVHIARILTSPLRLRSTLLMNNPSCGTAKFVRWERKPLGKILLVFSVDLNQSCSLHVQLPRCTVWHSSRLDVHHHGKYTKVRRDFASSGPDIVNVLITIPKTTSMLAFFHYLAEKKWYVLKSPP